MPEILDWHIDKQDSIRGKTVISACVDGERREVIVARAVDPECLVCMLQTVNARPKLVGALRELWGELPVEYDIKEEYVVEVPGRLIEQIRTALVSAGEKV